MNARKRSGYDDALDHGVPSSARSECLDASHTRFTEPPTSKWEKQNDASSSGYHRTTTITMC